MDGRGDDRRRRVGAHAAGVRPLVAVEDRFVVLSRGEGKDDLAIGEGEKRGLLSFEELLNDNLAASLAEGSAQHDGVDRGDRLLDAAGDHHPFAGSQAVGLDDDGSTLPFNELDSQVAVDKGVVGGGGDTVLGHNILGERLAPLDAGRRPVGAENGQSGSAKAVDDAQGERQFGADNGQPDLLLPGKVEQSIDIVDRQRHAFGNFSDAGVARCAVETFHHG